MTTPNFLIKSIVLAIAIALAAAVHDFLVYVGVLPYGSPELLNIATPVLLIALGAALIDRFVRSLADVEKTNAELESRIHEREQLLKRNFDRLRESERVKASAQERQRIMQDMHDGLGSQLLSSLMLVERGALTNEQVAQILRESIDDMRLAIDALAAENSDLLAALGNMRYRMEPRLKAAGMELQWDARGLPEEVDIDPDAVLPVLRIVQEALTNAIKHSRARAVRVTLGVDHGGDSQSLSIRVTDNGRGLAAASGAPGSGRGLLNMRNRAGKIGAVLKVETVPGRRHDDPAAPAAAPVARARPRARCSCRSTPRRSSSRSGRASGPRPRGAAPTVHCRPCQGRPAPSDSLFEDDPVPDAPRPGQASAVAPAWLDESLFRLGRQLPPTVYLGTSSWSFPGWQDIVYSRQYTEAQLARARTGGVLAAPDPAHGRHRPQLLPAAGRRRLRALREPGAGGVPLRRQGAVAGERRRRPARTRRAGRRQPVLPRRRPPRSTTSSPRRSKDSACVPVRSCSRCRRLPREWTQGDAGAGDDRTHRHDARGPAARGRRHRADLRGRTAQPGTADPAFRPHAARPRRSPVHRHSRAHAAGGAAERRAARDGRDRGRRRRLAPEGTAGGALEPGERLPLRRCEEPLCAVRPADRSGHPDPRHAGAPDPRRAEERTAELRHRQQQGRGQRAADARSNSRAPSSAERAGHGRGDAVRVQSRRRRRCRDSAVPRPAGTRWLRPPASASRSSRRHRRARTAAPRRTPNASGRPASRCADRAGGSSDGRRARSTARSRRRSPSRPPPPAARRRPRRRCRAGPARRWSMPCRRGAVR